MTRILLNSHFVSVLAWGGLLGSGSDLQGPLFVIEPAHRVEFGAATGGRIDCTGHGSPLPDVEWVLPDGTSVQQVIIYLGGFKIYLQMFLHKIIKFPRVNLKAISIWDSKEIRNNGILKAVMRKTDKR